MQLTRLPFWTKPALETLDANKPLLFSPENAFTELDSEVDTEAEATANAAGATAAEAATMDAMAGRLG